MLMYTLVGVIGKVSHSMWAAPIAPAVKNGGSVCICGDYKLTASKSIVDKYGFGDCLDWPLVVLLSFYYFYFL